MARGITEQDVWNAADDLDRNGIKPTPTKIREKIGSGSFTTIGRYLENWRGSDDAPDPGEIRDEALAPIIAALKPALAKWHQDLMTTAEEQHALDLREHMATVHQLAEEGREQKAEIARLEREIELRDQTIRQLDKANARLAERLDQVKPPQVNDAPRHPAADPADVPGQLTIAQAIEQADRKDGDWRATPLWGFISDPVVLAIAEILGDEDPDTPLAMTDMTVNDWLDQDDGDPWTKALRKAGCMPAQIDQARLRITYLARSYEHPDAVTTHLPRETSGAPTKEDPARDSGQDAPPDPRVDLHDHPPADQGKNSQTWFQWLVNFPTRDEKPIVSKSLIPQIHALYRQGKKPTAAAREILSHG